jgi:hypothetical protein
MFEFWQIASLAAIVGFSGFYAGRKYEKGDTFPMVWGAILTAFTIWLLYHVSRMG